MGMDIYGIKPLKLIADAVEPSRPQNEDEEGMVKYFEARDKYDKEVMPGRYFRANLWSWRPIQVMCTLVNQTASLNLKMDGWGENSGKGLRSQKECSKLADSLEIIVDKFSADKVGKIYLDVSGFTEDNQGMYVKYKALDNTSYGREDVSEFLTEEDYERYAKGIKFLQSQGVYVKQPYLIEHNDYEQKDPYILIEPAHSVYVQQIREFIVFLRNCGGFEIW